MSAPRPPFRFLVALAALALSLGCQNTGVVVVSVVFSPATASQCTRLELVTAKSAIVLTEAVKRPTDDDTVRFGIAPGKTLEPGQLYVTALGYRSPTCDGPTEERSERVAVSLGDPGAQRFTVTLRGKPGVDGGVDADHDGVPAPLDCDDTDPDVKPGGVETRCGNQKDDDCDGKKDCADGDCEGLACPDQDLCTSGEVCTAGVCQTQVLACEDAGVCGVAPGGCDAGVCVYPVAIGRPCDADGGLCRSNGACATGEAFCGDGLDDDHDGLTDCEDPDCFAQTCDAGAACVIDQACQTDHTCRGAMRVCPTSGCFATAACSEPAGCQGLTPKDAGAACGDGGTCQGDGGCSLVELNCGNGIDDDGDGPKDCLDPDCAGAQCNDANACSVGEVCSAGVCGGGTAVTCSTPTNPCLTALACDPTAGCQTTVATFAACATGYCLPDAGCGNPFRYAPTGFDPQAVPQPAGRWLVDCQTDIDTTPGATNTFCHDGGVTLSTLSLDGGDALLITTQELAVTDGGLGFHGTRPVVIAVYGHAFINGFVNAIHSGANAMQPAGGDLPTGPLSPGCAQGDGRGADGTTTGGGSPGSGGGSGGAFGAPGGLGGAGNSG
ncbi:MAG: hypothetical protein K1X89_26650, partial [Myxococcaceae bacterium]|nr:hypothetical protein [Myxococcaceae bacterium]